MNIINWYEPLKKKNKKKTRRIIGISIIGLVVISALASILLPNRTVSKPDIQQGSQEIFPSDKNEFFDNFYTSTTTDSANIEIEEVDSRPDFVLESTIKPEEVLDLSKVYEKCAGSIVGIKGYTVNSSTAYSWGTGIIISQDGLIMTNTHIIEDCVSAKVVLFNDKEYDAKLVGADSISDIAILKIDAYGLVPAEFGDSSELVVGESCAAIGNPLGDNFSLTLTDGIISAIDRGINYKGYSMTLIQTNTALNEGNSGGALFNMYGQVIGITNMKMMSTYVSIEGIGFAIPSNTCVSIANELINNGKVTGRSSIGITVGTVPDEAMRVYNLPSGLYVSDVVENSDAAKKGIQIGDVIVAVNGTPCTTTNEVNEIKQTLSVGDFITLTIYRDGETFDVDVMLMDTTDLYD